MGDFLPPLDAFIPYQLTGAVWWGHATTTLGLALLYYALSLKNSPLFIRRRTNRELARGLIGLGIVCIYLGGLFLGNPYWAERLVSP